MNRPRIAPALQLRIAFAPRRGGSETSTRAEQSNDKLTNRIECAPCHPSSPDTLRRHQRDLQRDAIAPGNPQLPNRLAARNRGHDGSLVDDLGRDAVVAPAWDHRAMTSWPTSTCICSPNNRAFKRFDPGKQQLRFDPEAPFQKPLALVGALLLALETINDDDQAQAVALAERRPIAPVFR